MNFVKFGAAVSAVFMLAACESSVDANDGSAGAGANSGAYGDANGSMAGSNMLAPGVGDRVYFATDSSAIDAEAEATLSAQANWLQQHPELNIAVEGHCDERGTREYNLALGERRANSAKNYLVSLGVSASRITTISYGKERPADMGNGDAAWSQNRRAVTVIAR